MPGAWIAGRQQITDILDDIETPRGGRVGLEQAVALRLMRRAYELRAEVTAYEASYVALAEALDCQLVTTEGRLAGATGPCCALRVLTWRRPSLR